MSGDTCFHFDRPKEKTNGEDIIVILQAKGIRRVQGTLKDKKGKMPVAENYYGPVRIAKSHIHDRALTTGMGNSFGQGITKKGKRTIYPNYGFYYPLLKSNLILDIDRSGHIWLTTESFYEISLKEKIGELKQNIKEIKNQISEIYDELAEIEHAKCYEYMAAEQEGRLDIQAEKYYSSLLDQLGGEEERRMDIETDGFWRIQND